MFVDWKKKMSRCTALIYGTMDCKHTVFGGLHYATKEEAPFASIITLFSVLV